MSVVDDVVANLNQFIDNREVATKVTGAAVLGALGGLYRLTDRYLIHRKRVTIASDSDQAMNIKEHNLAIALADGSADVDSIAILRFANTGTESVELDSPENDRFRIAFSGRTVRTIKVREPEEGEGRSRRRFGSPGKQELYLNELRTKITMDACEVPGDETRIAMPLNVLLHRGQSFQLAVFLSGKLQNSSEKFTVAGRLGSGKVLTKRHAWWRGALPAVLAAALVVSFSIGVLTAHRALTPRATCMGDLTLNIEGSTAFAHVVSEAAADYTQQCAAARISLTADGSDQAIADNNAAP